MNLQTMAVEPGLQNLLHDFGRIARLEGLGFEANGACAIRFDQALVVNFIAVPAEQALLIYTDLGAPASPDQLLRLLRANLFWRGTDGATLGCSDDEPPQAVLALQLKWRGETAQSLATRVTRFMAAARQVIATIEADHGGSAGPSSSPEDETYVIVNL